MKKVDNMQEQMDTVWTGTLGIKRECWKSQQKGTMPLMGSSVDSAHQGKNEYKCRSKTLPTLK